MQERRRRRCVMQDALRVPAVLMLVLLHLCDLTRIADVCAAVDQTPLSLSVSLVDLLNTEDALWTVSLGSPNAAGGDISWTSMKDVQVEMGPAVSAASLHFATPELTSPLFRTVEEEADYERKQSNGILGSAQTRRRTVLAHPALSFHTIACEEYKVDQPKPGSVLEGQCFFQRDFGDDFYFHYQVMKPVSVPHEEGAVRPPMRDSRKGRSEAAAAAPRSALPSGGRTATLEGATEPQTTQNVFASALWAERIVLPGDGAAVSQAGAKRREGATGEQKDHVGNVSVVEYVRQMADKRHSQQVALTLTMTIAPDADSATSGVVHLRIECLTGAYSEEKLTQHPAVATMSHTSFMHRWVWPFLFIAGTYGLIAAAARWVVWRRTSQGAAAKKKW